MAPGAGADGSHSALVAIDEVASAAGVAVRRMDFPYKLAGRRAPDRAPVLVEAVVSAAGALAADRRLPPARIFLGGRSMGGRMCSVAVAEGLPAAGLVLVSYPLHAPGRGDQLRSGHFGSLRLPCLFMSGTKDAFGTPTELEEAVTAVPGPVKLEWLEGADHSLRRRDAEVAQGVLSWLSSYCDGSVASQPGRKQR